MYADDDYDLEEEMQRYVLIEKQLGETEELIGAYGTYDKNYG